METFFGELALLTSQPRSASVRATNQCDLFMLRRKDFLNVLKQFPEFERTLETMKEKYIFK